MKQEMLNMVLQAELKSFGLNPSEWNIEKIHAAEYMIKHKTDKDFSFWGKLQFTKTKRPTWKILQLASI